MVQVGDLFVQNQKMMELVKAPSRTDLRLAAAAEEIHAGPPDPLNGEQISFQHSVLCQTSLPYRSTPGRRRWEAQNGNVMLLVQAGEAFDPRKKQWVELPLPFGTKARLILLYLNSEAIRTQSPVIDVEDSMTAFLRQLQGRDPNGDEIQKFKQQLAALASAKISMAAADHSLDPNAISAPHGNLPIVKFIELWFPKNPNQRVLWPGKLELTLDYFNDLLHHAVPLDQRAVAALSHSAMALDIYAWLAQRLHRVKPNRPYPLPWTALHQQFGHGYKEIRQFRSAFLKTLKDVLTQYPEAQIESFTAANPDGTSQPGGLLLKNSPPPVRKRLVQITGS